MLYGEEYTGWERTNESHPKESDTLIAPYITRNRYGVFVEYVGGVPLLGVISGDERSSDPRGFKIFRSRHSLQKERIGLGVSSQRKAKNHRLTSQEIKWDSLYNALCLPKR